MAHQALYRVYRPRDFHEVMGQGRVVDTLREAVRQNRLTHAYLFAGPRGTGKTSVARIMAKALNCQSPHASGEPCLGCSACKAVEQGQHLDVIEIDAASNRGIDEMRDIKERIGQAPVMGRYKIYIIDEVHMLTTEAFNALLKTLEEPPEHVIFILATTEAQKLPVTVLSRCQRYEFQRLSVGVIEERLRQVAEQEGFVAEPDAIELIAEYADGALRDALSLLDQALAVGQGTLSRTVVADLVGTVDPALMLRLMTGLSQSETLAEVMVTLDTVYHLGRDYRSVLRDLAKQIRDVIIWRQAGHDLFPQYRQQWLAEVDQALPTHIAPAQWFHALEILAEADTRLRGGFPAQLSVELALLKIREEWGLGSPPPVLEAVHAQKPPTKTPLSPRAEPANTGSIAPEPVPVQGGGGTGNRVPLLLETIRQERLSTHALLNDAKVIERDAQNLDIIFSFPAHRDLMMTTQNKALLDQVIQRIYGPGMRYHLTTADNAAETGAPPSQSVAPPLEDSIREWLGPDVPIRTVSD
ncbi:DNA polymerase III subunit gamma/tau [Sulfobacillus sp. hq2]|uniref:DNA polymerase III subunit gamma/tau n=1 Tax=Sulfobacillus sp. hq2 TaxID=2039167 RepID=UPI000CD16786|nr:DNA polymerase III subunit gamma/tau [Sulfobacillus sp. hq2]POB12115.1 DNA polymerase III subunit gamma/tau [Sulfobacillus sp. hq2]